MGDVTYDDVRKEYDDTTAVEGLDIEIEDGEFVTLVGPSGCGKSTSLEMIAGLTEPTSGSVSIDGENVTGLPPKDRDIAMVFQNIALFPHMDVYDNISYGLRLRDTDKAEVDRRVEEAAKMVQMEGMLDRMPDEMSGGQQQRVAIARAIVREPAVFLMDEPLANLDAKLRVHMRTQLQELHRQLDTTIIYVTHNQEEAMTMSSRIAVMNEGKLQQFDEPLECYYHPTNRFVAGFIGSPSMNFVEGRLTAEGVETDHFTLDIERELPDTEVGQRVTVGVRPEDITLAAGATFETDSGPVDVQNENEMDGTYSDPIDVVTDVLEPVGDDIYVYTRFPDQADRGGSVAAAGEPADGGTAGEQDDGQTAGSDAAGPAASAEGETGPASSDAGGDGDSVEAGENTGEERLLMSIPPMPEMSTYEAEGQRTQIVLNREMVHLFDGETGDAITHGLTPETASDRGTSARAESD
jgi:multiple sugar transport system ATP-binding protein